MRAGSETLGRQLRSRVTPDGRVELFIQTTPVRVPEAHEVLVRVEAAPINPSDLGLLLARADPSTFERLERDGAVLLSGRIPARALPGLQARIGEAQSVGNEGAGTVVAAGATPAAQALLGRKVAVAGGGMYADYRLVPAKEVFELPPHVSAAQGASSFVNPMTALCMIEVMRAEGHVGLVHTAAASNLGRMLNRICKSDDIPLVNIVRSSAQRTVLEAGGALHVVDSSDLAFARDLANAIRDTQATLAFDAVGGGELATQILSAMEANASHPAAGYSRYGSSIHKQVYIYGGLDQGPTVIVRNFGMAWSIGGWLLRPVLARLGPHVVERMRARIRAELTTTFVSQYAAEISLEEVLDPDIAAAFDRKGTSSKYIIRLT